MLVSLSPTLSDHNEFCEIGGIKCCLKLLSQEPERADATSDRAMKLRKAPHPDPTGSGSYFFTQAGHRQTAVEMAIGVIRKACGRDTKEATDDQLYRELIVIGRDWAI